MLTDRLRIVVLGYVVRGPVGGMPWAHLLYLIGLARLGHDVWFLEDSDDYPSCYDPTRHTTDADPTYGLQFAASLFARIGLGERWAYHDAHTETWHGPAASRLARVCVDADLLLDLSGVNPLRAWVREIPHRVLIDTDPVFTQLRHLDDAAARARAEAHTAFFTFAGNVGDEGAAIPRDGFPWQPTRQPMVPDVWRAQPPMAGDRFTTVMQWESYPPLEHQGQVFGMKSAAFEPYLDVPSRASIGLEVALGGASAPSERLRAHGWHVSDPLQVAPDPWTYQRFIQTSGGEFTVAKHGYVVSNSGWFSERSLCYLASAKPVVSQDTGFSAWLPVGEGLVGFADADQAVAALETVAGDYERHCRTARELAQTYFGYESVLNDLLERAVASRPV